MGILHELIALTLVLAFLLTTSLANGQDLSSDDTDDSDVNIIGGEKAGFAQFPYQISFRNLGQHSCGGVILTETKIASAAHCCQIPIAEFGRWTVVAGTNRLKGGDGQERHVKNITSHENYNRANQDNDVCMITLKRPLEFNNKVQPIDLCNVRPKNGAECIVSGWGSTRLSGPSPDDLQFVNTFISPQERCKREHQNDGVITENMICAGNVKGKGACHGDSGGPLACDGCLAGLVSWGTPCARGNPDVYANINAASVRNFLRKNM